MAKLSGTLLARSATKESGLGQRVGKHATKEVRETRQW